MTLFRFLSFAVLCIFTFSAVPPALAHGGEPRLEISVDRVNVGGTVDLRGVNFEPELPVVIFLNGSAGELPLGQLTADLEGTFLQIITVPTNLVEGTYTFHARVSGSDEHDVFSPPVIVSGSAFLGNEEGGQRGQEEPLLAPVPTSPAAPVQNAALTAGTASLSSQLDLSWPALLVTALMAIGMILFFSRGTRRRR